jgi:hypothetical protein
LVGAGWLDIHAGRISVGGDGGGVGVDGGADIFCADLRNVARKWL